MKTPGQIAHEAGEKAGGWARRWGDLGERQRSEWEAIAKAVVTAQPKREPARLTDEQLLVMAEAWASSHKPMRDHGRAIETAVLKANGLLP